MSAQHGPTCGRDSRVSAVVTMRTSCTVSGYRAHVLVIGLAGTPEMQATAPILYLSKALSCSKCLSYRHACHDTRA